MTSKRNVEGRLDDLESADRTDEETVCVVSIGPDHDRTEWMTHEEHEQHFGKRPESEFNFHINGSGQ